MRMMPSLIVAMTLPGGIAHAGDMVLDAHSLDRIRAGDARAEVLAAGLAQTAGPGDTRVRIDAAALTRGDSARASAAVRAFAVTSGGGSTTSQATAIASTSVSAGR